MNIQGLFDLSMAASHTAAGAGLLHWANASTGAGSIRRALDHLLPFATGRAAYPYHQTGPAPWTNLAPMLLQAYSVFGRNRTYLDAIPALNFNGAFSGNWTEAWAADPSHLLWPAF